MDRWRVVKVVVSMLLPLLSTSCIRNGQGEVATEDSLVITSVATLERDTPSVLVREVTALEEALSSGDKEEAKRSLKSVHAQLEQIEASLAEPQVVRKPVDSIAARQVMSPADSLPVQD